MPRRRRHVARRPAPASPPAARVTPAGSAEGAAATAAPTAAAAAALALARALGEAPDVTAAAATEPDTARTDVCTVEDVARWLGVNRKTVYDGVNRRELPCARLGRRVLFSRSAITAWLAGRAS